MDTSEATQVRFGSVGHARQSLFMPVLQRSEIQYTF